jgi:hypothetical protein
LTPSEAVQKLLDAEHRVKLLEVELENAKAEQKELERKVLPPLFLQNRVSAVDLDSGARAVKSMYSYARLAKEGPKRVAMLNWLVSIGEQDSIKPTLTMQWGRGDWEVSQKMLEIAKKDETARVTFEETVQWKSLESYVLREVKKGSIVPLDEIGAEIGDQVKITKHPKDPTLR